MVDDSCIVQKSRVKYLGVHIDSQLQIPSQIKSPLKTMAQGINTNYKLEVQFQKRRQISLLRAHFSHLHFSAVAFFIQ